MKRINIGFVGDFGAGKTSLIEAYLSQNNIKTYQRLDASPVVVFSEDEQVQVRLWDTAGAERYKAIVKSYYRMCDVLILCFDLQKTPDLDYWFEEIRQKGWSGMPIVLCGTKCDTVEEASKLEVFGEQIGQQKDLEFYVTFATDGTNIREVIQAAVRQAKQNP